MKNSLIESCEVTPTHLYLKVVNRRIKAEVKVGDVVQAGFVIYNSEVGLGSLRVEPIVFRLVCKNGLICKDRAQKKYLNAATFCGNCSWGLIIRDTGLLMLSLPPPMMM